MFAGAKHITCYLLLFTAAGIFVNCSNSQTKVSEETRRETLEEKVATRRELRDSQPKPSDRFKGKLSQAELKQYVSNAPAMVFDTKFGKPFDKINFDKVIAYDYDGDEEQFNSVVNENGNFIQIIEKQQALNKTQIEFLVNKILTSTSTYGAVTAACFNPHMGLVFYKGTERVFVVDICLGCNYLASDIAIPAMESHQRQYEDITITDRGFSKKGKSKIMQLAKELNFFYGE
ncbi:hypothetical protein [Flavobacterium sp.]